MFMHKIGISGFDQFRPNKDVFMEDGQTPL